MAFRFCPECGGAIQQLILPDEQRERAVCSVCQRIHYQNPHVVVGSVAFWRDQVLLCRRAIEPRVGYWALPAGYLELDETTEAGAAREAWEEAHAELEIRQLLAVYNLVHLNQVQILYLADLRHDGIYPGEESLELGLFGWDEIPWAELAFPSVHWALRHARQMRLAGSQAPELRSRQLELGRDMPL